ncbi:MAG TPA: L-threonylcarbamoyladenylate synthase [Candidatus Pacearchaeota archaeon]|jgi:L-threonylcarbamoyladenylate synthase|nr:L-threonylcarbamoyladenylate synthase [Candidatus Pacearchaeota archaeon]|tara:strand:+ start:30 stop:542 length:513 start_codon:yes stop_codon:yes gene_type:complete
MKELKEKILSGKIFIYPTDTVYGLGCDATNKNSVKKIKEIKFRDKDKPLSIIAPSIKWIKENCIIEYNIEDYLPGPYTLILKKKNVNFLNWVSETNTLGIRIPNNDFCDKIRKIRKPFITTSVNLSGENPAVSIKDINIEIIKQVDEVIDNGKLNGKSSTLIINNKEIKR